MTNTPNDTDIIAPASETVVERPRRSKAWWIAGGGIALAIVLGGAALGVSIAEAADDDDDRPNTSQVSDVRDDDRSDDRDDRSDDRDNSTSAPVVDDDVPISETERESAIAAALQEVGDGTVTDVDRSDDSDHAWEVEVTFADGRDVDVELNSSYEVVRVDEDN